MKKSRRKPRRSLRTILIVWFLMFSIVPLAFVTWYSLSKFERAIDRELAQRLAGNAREISGILTDFMAGLQQKRDQYVKDPTLIYHLGISDGNSLRGVATNWLRRDFASGLTFFNREGRMILSVFKDQKGEPRTFQPTRDAVFLSEKYISALKKKPDLGLAEFTENSKASLVLISRVRNSSGRIVGYLEQMIDLDRNFLAKLKSRTKSEVMIFRDNAQLIIGSHPDFQLYRKDFFRPHFQTASQSFFELSIRGAPYGFLAYPLEWDQTPFFIALGASKADAEGVLQNINYAFVTVVGALVVLLTLTTFVASSWVLRPLDDLVEALQSFESEEQAVTIPVKNDTEIGLLTESFNEMSKKIWKARSDLRKKITELEAANSELKETQSRLVHSAKMVSLGQLVAGVAHELNNPIGFIYSNMTHLKDYAGRLMKLVETAEKNPKRLKEMKEELEYDYVVKDLPKLITSCEDGARRTRDIVLGLRNFSRLEEARVSEVDLSACLDATLDLLQGEIKGRIQVHRNYESIPMIKAYTSQINQVLMNILSNAVQAIEGNGEIWVSTMPLKGRKGAEAAVQVSIQDNGRGMPPEVLEKIFDPFFTTKGVGQGTGLGLSISYGIIHSHGGDLQVRSEVGVGTEFIIVLPVRPPLQNDA
ncbi:MAG: HAMP domain-containing protein [Bdellovibrionaceae bacterium]|nr:HAMP domain-containing protein [Pseudobdellovibrionaceae bacterium]